MKIPILPLEVVSVQRERYSFGLNHRERLEVVSHRPRLAVSFGSGEQVGEVVELLHGRRDSVSTRESESIVSHDGGYCRSISRNEMRILEVDSMSGKVCRTTTTSFSIRQYIQRRERTDVKDLGSIGIQHDVEIERMGVEVLVLAQARVHKCSLQSSSRTESFVVPNRPAVCDDLVRFDTWLRNFSVSKYSSVMKGLRLTNISAECDDSRIRSHGILTSNQFLVRDSNLQSFGEFLL